MKKTPKTKTPKFPRQKPEKVERISKNTAFWMIACALMVDLVELLVSATTAWVGGMIINPFISFFATMSFWLWFTLKGAKLFNAKKRWVSSATPLLEIFPGLDLLGGFFWTLGVSLTVWLTWQEDKKKNEDNTRNAPELTTDN